MKQKIMTIIKIGALCAVSVLLAFELVSQSKHHADQSYLNGYNTGYTDASQVFKDWLLEVGYAEFDRKTGDWKLADANTIQGDHIEPTRKVAMVNIDDQIRMLEDELVLLRKQQVANSKRKSDIKKSTVDFKKL